MPSLLQKATMFVAPSVRDRAGNQDGLPNVILEAMACGRPVVASNIAGIPIVVKHNITGILVPPGDPNELAASIIRLLESSELQHEIGQRARQLIECEFSWSRVVEQMEALIS